MRRHVVMFSGGIGSWAAAKRVAERHGTDDLTLRELRERVQGGGQVDMLDIGGCGCFVDEEAA